MRNLKYVVEKSPGLVNPACYGCRVVIFLYETVLERMSHRIDQHIEFWLQNPLDTKTVEESEDMLKFLISKGQEEDFFEIAPLNTIQLKLTSKLGALIVEKNFERAFCPHCDKIYTPHEVSNAAHADGSGVEVCCANGHALYSVAYLSEGADIQYM